MAYFLNVAEPYPGTYASIRSYYDYFKNNLVLFKWVNPLGIRISNLMMK